MSLRILVHPYNNFAQNTAGGVQSRVRNYLAAMEKLDCNIAVFDKMRHKVEDWDIIHFFKLSLDHYDLMQYAKNKGVKIAISSIVPLEDKYKIRAHRLLCKLVPLHTIHDILSSELNLADIVLTQSTKESEFIHRNYGISTSKLRSLPNGVTSKVLNGKPEIAYRTICDKPYILLVGRIDSNKNQLNVIRAMSPTNIPVVIVGGPDPFEPQYYEQCIKEAGPNIHFTGWIDQNSELLPALYAAAKVLVCPSFKETFGNVILEGCATNCNVVYSENLPISALDLGKGTWTINPNDVKSIRNALISAYTAPTTPQLRENVMRQYSWDAIAERHLNIFNDIVNNG